MARVYPAVAEYSSFFKIAVSWDGSLVVYYRSN